MKENYLIRLLDISVALFVIVCGAPVFLLITILVRKKMGKPALFKQVRPGFHGIPFEMFKFRTMRNAFDSNGISLPDEKRFTVFGQFLRSTSLDELPEFINVLKGQMSLVGPRPLLMQYLPLYDNFQKKRHDVRPGITGWAQINGRNAISWQKKFELDVWYVEHKSVWLNLKILFLTIRKVVFRENITQEGKVTVEFFNGNN
jgi:lipopolysaccharide/colanic/teichoic acid biosynthesis glycosyltransferase